MRDDPLDVAEGRARECEGAHAHDGDRQREDQRLLRSPGDQPGRGRGQREAGEQRERSEADAEERSRRDQVANAPGNRG